MTEAFRTYPDPDVVSLDPRFDQYRIGNSGIWRVWTGALWAEGPAWNGVGRYLVWSDIPNDRQLRWLMDDDHVGVFRKPSRNSNGNTFDAQGRQLSCEHAGRRVVRYEHDGSVTVIADRFEGKRLNSPNDVVVHPDGGVWFTDPPYGSGPVGGYEGEPGPRELPNAVYRADPSSGRVERVNDELDAPNGLCFSADYRRLYLVDTGEPHDIQVLDVVDDRRLTGRRQFTDMRLDGVAGSSDGVRTDVDGNLWAAAGWGGARYDGVHVFTPDGERIGQIRLPEPCANLCFGGPKRNLLLMTASHSVYALYVNTRGAHVS